MSFADFLFLRGELAAISSASADQRSSMSSSVSRILSKSATSMTTFEATPFCVMRSGRRVLVLRLKHSAIVLRKVENVTTSSARRIVFIVRSSTGMWKPLSWSKGRKHCTTSCTLASRDCDRFFEARVFVGGLDTHVTCKALGAKFKPQIVMLNLYMFFRQ